MWADACGLRPRIPDTRHTRELPPPRIYWHARHDCDDCERPSGYCTLTQSWLVGSDSVEARAQPAAAAVRSSPGSPPHACSSVLDPFNGYVPRSYAASDHPWICGSIVSAPSHASYFDHPMRGLGTRWSTSKLVYELTAGQRWRPSRSRRHAADRSAAQRAAPGCAQSPACCRAPPSAAAPARCARRRSCADDHSQLLKISPSYTGPVRVAIRGEDIFTQQGTLRSCCGR